MSLPEFKPGHLEVNKPVEIKIEEIKGPFDGNYGPYYNMTVLRDGVSHAMFINKDKLEQNEHVIQKGARVVVIHTKTEKGYSQYNYAPPGDISVQARNLPAGHNANLNTRQAQKKSTVDCEYKADIWEGQSKNLTAYYFAVNCKTFAEYMIALETNWEKIYRNEKLMPEKIKGYIKPIESVEKKETGGPTIDDIDLDPPF